MFDLFARFIEHGYAFPGRARAPSSQIHVSPVVDGHAVGAQLAKEFFVLKRAVGLDVVLIGFICTNIGDVKCFVVRGADDSVRLFHILGHGNEFFSVRRQIVRDLFPPFHLLFRPPRSGI